MCVDKNDCVCTLQTRKYFYPIYKANNSGNLITITVLINDCTISSPHGVAKLMFMATKPFLVGLFYINSLRLVESC